MRRRWRRRRARGSIATILLFAGIWALSQVPPDFPWGTFLLVVVLGASAVIILAIVQRRRRMLYLKDALSLSPTQFEEAMADLFRDLGYRHVKRTGGAGDLAADITCEDEAGRRVVIQCKRYAPHNRVGSPILQTFIGMVQVHHEADHGIFVTTSSFTSPARDLAKKQRITLYDGRDLADLVHRARQRRTGTRDLQKGAA